MQLTRKKSIKLCAIGGMFGAHLFYWKDDPFGVMMLIMTLAGIYNFYEDHSVVIITIPALINLYTVFKLYTMTDEQFDKQFNK